MSALSLEGFTAGYETGLPIVHDVDLSLAPGEFVGLFGPNGAGKSTLVKAIAGVARTFGGEARLGGQRLTGLKPHQVLARGLAFVPQTDNVFASLSIRENLLIAAAVLPAAERDAAIRRVEERFPDLTVEPRRTAGSLSGGQRQMLACARALMVSPSVLVMDEPSAGLSPRLASEVFQMLAAINAGGITVVLVEQNVRAALRFVGRGVVLVDGTIRLDEPAATLPDHADLGALFLGAAPATQ
jgi:branched-chain amino acid transport system ATP-binding protein